MDGRLAIVQDMKNQFAEKIATTERKLALQKALIKDINNEVINARDSVSTLLIVDKLTEKIQDMEARVAIVARQQNYADRGLDYIMEHIDTLGKPRPMSDLPKEAPAIIQSYCDKRVIGCPGGEGVDEHDAVQFWLEKGKPYECPVCSQYFELEVIGRGPPDGDGDEDDHH